MQDLRLFTTRLELVAATVELAQAEIGDLSAFAGCSTFQGRQAGRHP
jgi:hypothetical protein